MKTEFAELVGPLKELIAMRADLKKIIEDSRSQLSFALETNKFHGQVVPVSFRTYQGVADDFRAFAAGVKGIKNQDLVAQALVEFIERNQHLSIPPVSLILGRDLCKTEEKNHSFSKMIKELRNEISAMKSKTAPQVRVFDSNLIGAKDFVIKTDDGQELAGTIKDKSHNKLKSQLFEVMLEKALTQ